MVKAPLTEEAPLVTVKETPVARTKGFVEERLLMDRGVTATVMVGVVDVLSITASSAGPGTIAPCQFPPVPQRPLPAAPVQRILGTVRSSSCSKDKCLRLWSLA